MVVISLIYFITGLLFIMLPGSYPDWLSFLLKALMMPLLMVIVLIRRDPGKNRFNLLMLAGLIFSLAGDIFLEVPKGVADLFVPGLASFLLAQVSYLILFFASPGRDYMTGKRLFLVLPIAVYGMTLVSYLYDGLGEMRVPVMIYAAVILLMLAAAINRLEKVNRRSYWLVLTGAILFVVSDSSIAISKFGHSFRGASAVIMSTYLVAQYLIVTGYLSEHSQTADRKRFQT